MELFEALDKLMQAADWVGELKIIGGDPFMNKQAAQYTERCCQYASVSFVAIHSNGTIMPDENAWKAMQHEKVLLLLSDYGALSRKQAVIQKRAEDQ